MTKETIKEIPLQLVLDKLGVMVMVHRNMKCVFPENHKDWDKKQSATYDEYKNLFHCGVCGKGWDTLKIVGKKLGYDCSGKDFVLILEWFEKNFPEWDEKKVGMNTQGVGSSSIVGQTEKIILDELEPNPHLFNEIVDLGEPIEKTFRGIEPTILDKFRIRKYGKKVQDNMISSLQKKGYEHEYLKKYGVASPFLQWVWGSSKDYPNGLRVVIPHIENDTIKTLEGTDTDKDKKSIHRFMKGSHKTLFNIDTMKDMKEGDELWVVEGVWDTLSLYQMGLKVVGLAGAKEWDTHKDKFKPYRIKTILDNDKTGKELGDEMLKSGLNVQVFKWKGTRRDKFDINDLIRQKEKAGTPIRTIRELLDEVEPINEPKLGFVGRLLKHREQSRLLKKGEIKGFKLNNFPHIQSALNGIQRKGIWLIAGRTNIGKTGFVVCMGLDLIESNPNMKLIFICLDDTEEETENRMIANLGEVNIWETDIDTENKDKETKKMFAYQSLEKWGRENRLDIVDVETIGTDIDNICDYVMENKRENTCVIIDGMNNIETGERDSLKHDDKIGKVIKRLAVKGNLSIITTCEIRKSAEGVKGGTDTLNKKEITTDDVKGSVGLAYHANVISGCMAEDNDFSNPDKEEVPWNITFMKNKWARGKGVFKMKFHKYYVQMKEDGWKKHKPKKEEKEEKILDDKMENGLVNLDELELEREKQEV